MTPKGETQKLQNWRVMWLRNNNSIYLSCDTIQKLTFIIMTLGHQNKDKLNNFRSNKVQGNK